MNYDESKMNGDEKETQKEADKSENLSPDPGTLNTTDPQDHMHGPISDMIHGIQGEGDKSDSEDPVAAKEQEKRDEGPVRDHG